MSDMPYVEVALATMIVICIVIGVAVWELFWWLISLI